MFDIVYEKMTACNRTCIYFEIVFPVNDTKRQITHETAT